MCVCVSCYGGGGIGGSSLWPQDKVELSVCTPSAYTHLHFAGARTDILGQIRAHACSSKCKGWGGNPVRPHARKLTRVHTH